MVEDSEAWSPSLFDIDDGVLESIAQNSVQSAEVELEPPSKKARQAAPLGKEVTSEGPTSWVGKLRKAFANVLPAKLPKLSVATICTGMGTATVAMQVGHHATPPL